MSDYPEHDKQRKIIDQSQAIRMTMFSSVEREDVEPTCPYFQGTGDRKCKSGCWQEPICVTGEPLGGYRKPQHNPPNPILVAFRKDAADVLVSEEFDVAATARSWLDGDAIDLYIDIYPSDVLDHARHVLTRLARLGAEQ